LFAVHGYVPFWLNRQLQVSILDVFDKVGDGLIVVFRGQLIQHTLTESFCRLDELLYTVESHIAFDHIPDLLPLLDCLYRQVVATLFSFVVEVIQPALAVEQIDFVEVIRFSLNRDFFDGFCLVVHGFVSFLIVALDYIIQSRLARRIFSFRNKFPSMGYTLVRTVGSRIQNHAIDQIESRNSFEKIVSSSYKGNTNPWDGGQVIVTTTKGKYVWNTKVILNFSKYGLPFNQWPTRLA
jgi:hypothetical protein